MVLYIQEIYTYMLLRTKYIIVSILYFFSQKK